MIPITADLVSRLVAEQFPQWAALPIRPVAKSGHDNRMFHLGDALMVRLPSDAAYAEHVALELTWLPYLQERLPFSIASPVGAGKPGQGYPLPWSILQYLPGETLTHTNIASETELAQTLAAWLQNLQAIDAAEGPLAGQHNFYRGSHLSVYDKQTREALVNLAAVLPEKDLASYRRLWEEALDSRYEGRPVWVHGDVAVGNLLVQNGRLSAMIDFGTMGVGDPACDYVMAWTFFTGKARETFLAGLDADLIARAKGWALWKALITYIDENPDFEALSRVVLREVLTL